MNFESLDDLIEENYDDSDDSVSDKDVKTKCDIQSQTSSKRKKKSSNRTDTQFKFLKTLAGQINISMESQRPEFKASAWEIIENKLNAMGPPTHSINEWKKILTEHKCKSKTILVLEYGNH